MSEYKIGGYDIVKVQSVMLEIATEIDRICRLKNIRYILDGGTLLGAIRHKGFIPWDDDLDIAMLREDYDRFIEACNTDLDKSFFLETCEIEPDYPLDFAKLKKNNTVYMEKENEFRNIHQGVYVDIFPIDNVNLHTYRLQSGLYSIIRRARWRKIYKRILPKNVWNTHRMKQITKVAIPLTVFSETILKKWDNKIMRMYNYKETQYVYKVCHPNKVKPPYPRRLYTDIIEVPFENKRFFVPKDYDKFLKDRYGDYMKLPDKKQQTPGHGIIKVIL